MFQEMSNVKCLRCSIQFSSSDIAIMEEGESPVCDICVGEMCEVTVKYDGSKDLLEHLQTELKEVRCPHCYEEKANLDSIRYGSPVDGFMKCGNCSQVHIFDVHIEFV